MIEIIVVTNRALCQEPFLKRMKTIVTASPDRIILREKEISLQEYQSLAQECLRLNKELFTLHSFDVVAQSLAQKRLHMPFYRLKKQPSLASLFELGVSVHSVEEAIEAESLGASYLIAGHIFKTACKEGLAERGLAFLRDVCSSVEIPVYAIGGITACRVKSVIECGAKGVCIMSEMMTCEEPKALINELKRMVKNINLKE